MTIDNLTETEANSLKQTSKIIDKIEKYLIDIKHSNGQMSFSVIEKEYGFIEDVNYIFYKYGVNWYDDDVKIGVWVTLEDNQIGKLEPTLAKFGWAFKTFDNNLIMFKTKNLHDSIDIPFPENDFTAITKFLAITKKEAFNLVDMLIGE